MFKIKKIQNIDLKNQINDFKINLENTQRMVAEKIVIAGKVPLLERDNEDLKYKMKRYEENSDKLLQEINAITTEKNKLLTKIDEMMKNPQIVNAGAKSRTGLSMKGGNRSNLGTSDMAPISHGILLYLSYFFLYKINFMQIYLLFILNDYKE